MPGTAGMIGRHPDHRGTPAVHRRFGNSGCIRSGDGKILWHQRLTSSVSNGPSTWMFDGKQYIIVGAGDTLYALTLAGKP